jgi:hypothetical protein
MKKLLALFFVLAFLMTTGCALFIHDHRDGDRRDGKDEHSVSVTLDEHKDRHDDNGQDDHRQDHKDAGQDNWK